MRKYILLLLLTLSTVATAQVVGYGHGPRVEFYVEKQNGAYYMYVTMISTYSTLKKQTMILMRNSRDEVISLSGDLVSNERETSGAVVIGNYIHTIKENSSTALFKVRPDQFEAIRYGITKIRISAYPEDYQRTFGKDKIGKKIYRLYIDTQRRKVF